MVKFLLFSLLAVSAYALAFDDCTGQALRGSYVQKVDYADGMPRAWVGPGFAELGFERKQLLISAIAALCQSELRPSGEVIVFDAQSGRRIGAYSRRLGGLEMW